MRPLRSILASSLGLACLLVGGCRPAEPTVAPEPEAPPSTATAPSRGALAHQVRIFDAEGREHSLDTMLDVLADRRVVLLGETHLDDVTHQVEHAMLEGLAVRNGDRVVLSMEMFERDVQPTLDRYLDGEIDEATFLAQARPWGNYRTGYRPLVETARDRGLPVVAANTPRPVLRQAAAGAKSYAKAQAEHPQWLPEEVLPASDAYWARVDRSIRGHGPPGGGDRTYAVQNLWDNTMADAIVGATEAHPEHQVLHVVGGFHVEAHEGTVAQVRRRAPELSLATVTVTPTFDLARVKPDPKRADFVVYAQAYAEGISGDALAVGVPAQLRYRLHLPSAPPPGDGWPLLVWLSDDEERPADATLRWRLALGEEAAVLVVEPRHRTRAREGWQVRRWTWPQSQSQDLSATAVGLGRILEYARRRLPVTGGPVLVAGEGAGATVALWSSLYADDWEQVRVLAFDPALPRALRTASIPDRPSAVTQARVFGELDEGTQAGLRGASIETALQPGTGDRLEREVEVRRALGLGAEVPTREAAAEVDPLAPSAVAGRPYELRLGQPTPVGHAWAALYARMLRSRGHDATVVLGDVQTKADPPHLRFDQGDHTALLLHAFAEGKGLPRPPDPFGGAVVLLLPADAPRDAEKAWTEILTKTEAAQGVFKSPYRVARAGTEAVGTVLEALRAKGRTELRVVPAVLCADRSQMRRYLDAVEPHAEGLALHWLPGLGRDLVAAQTR